MSADSAQLAARLDRLPMTRHIWYLVTLISLGGCFEFYDLFLTAYIAPGLNRAGYFTPESLGPFSLLSPLHVAGIGTFVFAFFAGLFVGAICLGHVADQYGRRTVFTFSLVWYSVTTAVMALQTSGFGVDMWRFIAGIGIGVELVTIDTYVAELVPRTHRGRAFAYSQFFQFLAVPIVALAAWLLVPRAPLGFDGWRWVVLIGAAASMIIWVLRLFLPESPLWLARHGRTEEAFRILATLEARGGAVAAGPSPSLARPAVQTAARVNFADLFRPPYLSLVVLFMVFNLCQAFGFYGFANWVPTLLVEKGITVTKSLQYSFIVAFAYPIAPLLAASFADKFERRWIIAGACIAIIAFGMAFAQLTEPGLLIVCGVLLTACNTTMSYAYHAYQTEVFPTQIRAQASGLVYSMSRLSATFSGFIVAYMLKEAGVTGVFGLITVAMLIVVIAMALFGPDVRGKALDTV